MKPVSNLDVRPWTPLHSEFFRKIPDYILLTPGHARVKELVLMLYAYRRFEVILGKAVWKPLMVTDSKLARMMGCSKDTIRRIREELTILGWLNPVFTNSVLGWYYQFPDEASVLVETACASEELPSGPAQICEGEGEQICDPLPETLPRDTQRTPTPSNPPRGKRGGRKVFELKIDVEAGERIRQALPFEADPWDLARIIAQEQVPEQMAVDAARSLQVSCPAVVQNRHGLFRSRLRSVKEKARRRLLDDLSEQKKIDLLWFSDPNCRSSWRDILDCTVRHLKKDWPEELFFDAMRSVYGVLLDQEPDLTPFSSSSATVPPCLEG